MREIIGVPVGIIIYLISVVVIMAFCQWSFEKPQEWQTAIPIITSLFSMGIACGIVEDKFSKLSGKFLTLIIATFWIALVVVDITGNIQDLIGMFKGETPTFDELDMVMFYVDGVLNVKIFAITSAIMALGNFSK